MKDKVFGVLQRVGRSFMLPIAILPVAGLLLGIGSSFHQCHHNNDLRSAESSWRRYSAPWPVCDHEQSRKRHLR